MSDDFQDIPFYGDFTVYDTATGEIRGFGSGGPQIAPEGQAVLYGHAYDNAAYRIDPATGEVYEFAAPKNDQEILDEIVSERIKRLARGFNYDFGDGRGVHHIGTTEADMKGWDRVTALKDALFQAGDTASTILISTDTGPCLVTGPEWNAILLYAAVAFEQPIWQASFVLQAMQPLPQDPTNPAYWPEES